MTSLFVTGSHPLMQKIRSLASGLATRDTAVLIVGEHGTGKRDVALHIHQQSRSATGPFLPVDCASTSAEHLADSVERARGGTLFLNSVGALDTALQPLLWEVLDGKELCQPGSRSVRANVRLIASTEPALAHITPESDLLMRLWRIALFLPPLRERRSDIPLLIRHLLDQLASSHDGPPRRFPDDALVLLWQYDWPGNLRELEEVVRRSATFATDGVVYPTYLPTCVRESLKGRTAAGLGAGDSLEDHHFAGDGHRDRLTADS